MANCNSSASQCVTIRYKCCQLVKIILPFLTCMALTYCSRSLYLYLTEGHHVQTETMLLRMMQCAAFVAPTTAHLVHIFGYGPVLFIGACFTILGLSTPSFLEDNRHQEVAFAVLFGTGISIVFQATMIASATIFRSNIMCSFQLLAMCLAPMILSRQYFEHASFQFSVRIVTCMLVLVPVLLIFPAVADMIGARRSKKTDRQDITDPLLSVKADEGQCNSKDDELLKISLPNDKENKDFITEIFGQMKWKLGALLWWAVGIHLSFLSSCKEPPADIKMVSMMCLLSLFTLGVKVFLAEGKACRRSGCTFDNDAGYFVLGLLGLNGLMLRFSPNSTDVHCFSLLFTMGYFHQLPLYKMPQSLSNYRLINDQICVELALTFCAMAIGYQLANIIYTNVLVLIISSNYCSDGSLLMISAVIVLLSLRYSTKAEQHSKNATVKSECHGQA